MISVGIMLWILLVIGLVAIAFGFSFGMKTANDSFNKTGMTAFDAKQDYLKQVNAFIRKESAFELFKWINNSVSVKNANGASIFAEKIKDSAAVSKQVGIMTTIIYVRMSSHIKNAFYRVYGKDCDDYDGEDKAIFDYITRWVMFAVRRITLDLTLLLQDKPDTNFDDIVKQYILQLEIEIHKNNDIYLLSATDADRDSSEQSSKNTAI